MSSFHVKKILGEYPELRDIIPPKKMREIVHATVNRIGMATLGNCSSSSCHFYFVSKDKALITEMGKATWWELWISSQKTIGEKIADIGGIEKIAYLACLEKISYDGGPEYYELSVLKPPRHNPTFQTCV